MFSFFPCLPYEGHPRGFARPTIRIPGVIKDTHNQWIKLNRQDHASDVKRLWDEAVRQVTNQGLVLGIHASLPAPPTTTTNTTGLRP